MDDLQQDLAEGSAMDGASVNDVISADDLSRDAPWPRWAAHVVERTGVRSYLGFRLFVEDDSIGLLNLYAYEPGAFDHDDRLDGLVAAAHATVALSATVKQDQPAADGGGDRHPARAVPAGAGSPALSRSGIAAA